jgi:hypothetical protein
MSNAVLTAKNAPGVTAKLVAAHLKEKAKFIRSISKEPDTTWSDQYKSANPGDTIYVKKPARMTVGSNIDVTSTIQDLLEEKIPLVLNKVANVAFKMNSLETAYDRPIKYWNDAFVEPAMNALSAEMDKWALSTATTGVANLVGTAGTQPGAILGFLQGAQKIYENVAPEGSDMFGMINPATNTATVDARKGLFQKSDRIAEQYDRGYIGQGEGFEYMRSNLLPTITNGTATGAHTVTTTSVTGATTLAVTGTGTQTITAGTVISIAGFKEVHPVTKQAYSYDKQFVVTADATAVSGAYTLSISPAIHGPTSGSLQNVSALPTSSSVVTLFGSASTAYAQNLLYHPDAFRFVSIPLYTPKGRDFAASQEVDGINVRVLRDFDIRTSESIMRFDILGGLALVRPEWSCRYAG